jgi:predicted dehydrogenase
MRQWNFSEGLPGDSEVVEKYSENPPNVYGFGHVAYLRHVVDVLSNGALSLVDGAEGRKSLELIHAIYQSAETGTEITIGPESHSEKLGRK